MSHLSASVDELIPLLHDRNTSIIPVNVLWEYDEDAYWEAEGTVWIFIFSDEGVPYRVLINKNIEKLVVGSRVAAEAIAKAILRSNAECAHKTREKYTGPEGEHRLSRDILTLEHPS